MPPPPFFDANVTAGRPCAVPGPVPWDARSVGDLLDEFVIDRALVRHVAGKEISPPHGNEAILAITGGDDRLTPVWTVLPTHTGEMPAPDVFCARMGEHGVRAVAVYPAAHNWSLSDWCAGSLLAELETRRVPVLLDQEEADWEAVAGLLAAHPDLRLILVGGTYRNSRLLYPLFARYRHLYLEISGWQPHRAIEDAAARGYADRLLFGSRLPTYTAGSALAAVMYAEVSDDDRRRIAGETLRHLLEEARL